MFHVRMKQNALLNFSWTDSQALHIVSNILTRTKLRGDWQAIEGLNTPVLPSGDS